MSKYFKLLIALFFIPCFFSIGIGVAENTVSYESSSSLGELSTQSLILEDIDKDGDLDLIVGNGGTDLQKNTTWLNNGEGIFYLQQSLAADRTSSIASGDFNSDGYPDIVVGNSLGSSNYVWLNDGAGGFSDKVEFAADSNTQAVSVADFDNDDNDDILVCNYSGGSYVLYGNGAGGFDRETTISSSSQCQTVLVYDFRHDGFPEIILGNYNQNSILYDNDSNTFSTAYTFSSYPVTSIAAGDVDKNGKIDLVFGNMLKSNVIATNTVTDQRSEYGFSESSLGGNYMTRQVKLEDFNKDGYDDLYIAMLRTEVSSGSSSYYYDKLLLNDHKGSFIDSGVSFGNYDSSSVAVGKLNKDTDWDIVAGHDYDEPNIVWLGKSGGSSGGGGGGGGGGCILR